MSRILIDKAALSNPDPEGGVNQIPLRQTLFHYPDLLFGQSVKLVNQAVDLGFKGGGVGGGVLFFKGED